MNCNSRPLFVHSFCTTSVQIKWVEEVSFYFSSGSATLNGRIRTEQGRAPCLIPGFHFCCGGIGLHVCSGSLIINLLFQSSLVMYSYVIGYHQHTRHPSTTPLFSSWTDAPASLGSSSHCRVHVSAPSSSNCRSLITVRDTSCHNADLHEWV